ncbi:MAG: fused isobutyryl-CoA mutase/GTPase IcmF [Gammaproteobacteria bacterium]
MAANVQALRQPTAPSTVRAGRLRFVTAASLFDGHDASINIMRRILQASGVEVVHLGHNRSVAEVVQAALEEDAQGIAVSSYQGGHVEYFKYMVDMLRELGGGHVRVFGGGGGVIVPEEIRELHDYGVTRIYSPHDGQRLGLKGMIEDMIERCEPARELGLPQDLRALRAGDRLELARLLSAVENGALPASTVEEVEAAGLRAARDAGSTLPPVLGITGTGGAGKSSLTDELVRRLRLDHGDQLEIALLAVDPSRRKTGGALLGDRIRMNAIDHDKVYMRSLATRDAEARLPAYLPQAIGLARLAGFDLVIVETPGIGQGDTAIETMSDLSLYVMTPEYGAASQLEKIDMLDFADLVAINKFDRQGGEDALRDVSKQVQRNREAFDQRLEEMPVFGTIASRFNDDGVTALYQSLVGHLRDARLVSWAPGRLAPVPGRVSTSTAAIVPGERERYLAEIGHTVRDYKRWALEQSRIARERQQLEAAARMLKEAQGEPAELERLAAKRGEALDARARAVLEEWPELEQAYAGDELVVNVRGREIRTPLTHTSLSGTRIAKVALPRFEDEGERLRFLLLENLPGHFPFTAGVFAFKRDGEDPSRMFAGEGDAFRTNRRFKMLSEHAEAKRLSTAFDSVTLYGFDPDRRPDIYGKVGNSGVSIATLDDMKVLYDGFDLCDPRTSVSMTINGPAPTILAMFLNTAIDQRIDAFTTAERREPSDAERADINAKALCDVRGTVQADILKEDQGQNTCIFSTEFSLKVMGDIQAYFVEHEVRNFYSVSISGYHIAEAGANPITQLALTLSNGFTYVEAYLARGMQIDDFAPNLSFFFSNGMDPEYTVMGRVARRIWATTLRERYGANERSQKLKYHIQTSGRSLHAQEMAFNDIRTTLQALIATYDNCNSLHTNAYDEAITTPSPESVRRALAIQLVINKEWGLAHNENPNQGAFIIEALTDLVEEAVLAEFERISERGGVLGAMETGYQRGKVQDESIYYETRKHDGSLPIVGVNTFLNPHDEEARTAVALSRSSTEEKESQLQRLTEFHARHAADGPAALERLRQAAINDENVFAVLVDAVRCCSLGQITGALFEVGGKYRRNM